jgi:membrane associated rhomboid family serine protease
MAHLCLDPIKNERQGYKMQKWIDYMANKIRRIAVPNLMKYIVISMGAVFVMDLLFAGRLTQLLVFSRAAIQDGQIWRIISFIFIPISASPIFIVFVLYFYWMIGNALESEWGYARFNLFYLTGVVGTIIAGLITGYATNHYLNLSLFFAFAILFPNVVLRLFFILPVKVKWLAYVNAAYFAWQLIISTWPQRIALLVSIANIAIFFGDQLRNSLAQAKRRKQWRDHFR